MDQRAALYWPYTTADFEQRKSLAPERIPITGANVYISGVFRALLKYGSYERIFLPPAPDEARSDIRSSSLFAENRARVQALPEHRLQELQSYFPLVFFDPTAGFQNTTRLRRLSGCLHAPITGVIHALNRSDTPFITLTLLLSPLQHYDAVICSTASGRTVVQNILKLVETRLVESGWPRLKSSLQMPVIPLGVDVDEYDGGDAAGVSRPAGAGPRVLYLGRFSAASKADLFPLLIAYKRLLPRHPDLSLTLAGDDTHFRLADKLREFVNSYVPGGRVDIVPNPDLPTKKSLFASADVFVSPSDNLQETFGITLIEAMAAGLPSVVSDWDGYKEIVVEGETGFRVRTTLPALEPRFDDLRGGGGIAQIDLLAASTMIDIDELVARIDVLAGNPQLRREMGEAARRRARATYDWQNVVRQYESLWAELAERGRRDGPRSSQPTIIDQFRYQEMFSHYPSGFLSKQSRVRKSSFASEWPLLAGQLADGNSGGSWFQTGVFENILEAMPEADGIDVDTLLEAVGADPAADASLYMTHLCRLIKYGLINLE